MDSGVGYLERLLGISYLVSLCRQAEGSKCLTYLRLQPTYLPTSLPSFSYCLTYFEEVNTFKFVSVLPDSKHPLLEEFAKYFSYPVPTKSVSSSTSTIKPQFPHAL
jgi:hypothetical protein